jgi:tripartite-type tricarboxylate transporter receptor subunit TctC
MIKLFLALYGIFTLSVFLFNSSAQSIDFFPNRTVKIVVPNPPGGP